MTSEECTVREMIIQGVKSTEDVGDRRYCRQRFR